MDDSPHNPSSPAPENDAGGQDEPKAPDERLEPQAEQLQGPREERTEEAGDARAAEPARSLSTGGVVLLAILVALLVGTIAGGIAGLVGSWAVTHGDDARPGTTSIRVIPPETDEPIVAATAAALPSVVNVDVSGSTVSQGEDGLPEGHPGVPRMGNGSGVAYKAADGGGTYIITNAHVVADADTFVVRGTDGESHRAQLIGADDDTDIAVLKIDGSLPPIQLGDSEQLEVGQAVAVIGSPFGLSHSVSSGVVSGLGRSLPEIADAEPGKYPLVDVIQTDAAINPGNSGGALVDREGRLVGISSAMYSETGASGGVGFAIPVNTAMRVAEQLITEGKVAHPFLGVVGRDVDSSLAEEEGLAVEEGAYIVEITEGTEAEKAGLQTGDVIVGLDEDAIRSMDDLLLYVRRKSVGDKVSLRLYRDGVEMTLEMTVGEKPENLELPEPEPIPIPDEAIPPEEN
ncbi:MAG: trypsin-like peptidase domain-containing protein [Coriobacteriia bacterium]|nr:trypsin-like peptidase domain-containing protein [Coriobacteriia bacterium]